MGNIFPVLNLFNAETPVYTPYIIYIDRSFLMFLHAGNMSACLSAAMLSGEPDNVSQRLLLSFAHHHLLHALMPLGISGFDDVHAAAWG